MPGCTWTSACEFTSWNGGQRLVLVLIWIIITFFWNLISPSVSHTGTVTVPPWMKDLLPFSNAGVLATSEFKWRVKGTPTSATWAVAKQKIVTPLYAMCRANTVSHVGNSNVMCLTSVCHCSVKLWQTLRLRNEVSVRFASRNPR